MIVALEIDREIDLSIFSSLLFKAGIMHRIVESGSFQILSVQSEQEKIAVLSLYQHYLDGELQFQIAPEESSSSMASGLMSSVLPVLLRAPLVVTILCLNIICFPITLGSELGEFNSWFHAATFLEFKVVGNQLYFSDLAHTISSQQYWRLLTPMLLHFGWLHIVFNLLWIWEIGKRIEKHSGALILLLVVLASSIGANLMQYWLAGAGLFGGMSGVVFGLLGYALCWHLYLRAPYFGLPTGIYVFMLTYLALGFTGAIDMLGLGSLANGAHLGGLLAGLVFGTGTVFIQAVSANSRNSTS
ncbi:MAG: GlpG protein [Candidatus Azotimanducaceae bacterium]|jgi:GlpG protein